LASNDVWKYLKTNAYLAELGTSMDSIDNEVRKNEIIWELIASRPLLISVHEVRKHEYDYLYVIDLQKAAQFQFIKDYIDQLTDDETQVLSRDYRGTELIEIRFTDSPLRLYMTISENLLILSTTHTLVEQSIDQKNEPVIARDLDFIDISRHMDSDRPTFYLQSRYFYQFLQQWMTEEESSMLNFLKATSYSSFNIKLEEDHVALKGLSNLIDSDSSLLQAIQQSGAGTALVPVIAPANTSFFMSLCFDDSKTFYENISLSIKQSSEGQSYEEQKEKLEKFLDIDIEKHFLSWIDGEISLLQLEGSSSNEAYALAIRHRGMDETKENLAYVKERIRKKTPVKFRDVAYKDHTISFLSIKGFFKMLFGKTFEKVEKPYYTIIDDYVVFSNSPQTLGIIISNYVDGTTLDNSKAFADYMDHFDDESTLLLYINSRQLLEDSQKYLDEEAQQTLANHKKYIERFPMIGLQFKPKKDLLAHQLVFEYMDEIKQNAWNKLLAGKLEQPSLIVEASESEESIAIEDILPEDLNDDTMEGHYPNGQLKFEVPLKNGQKHGRYREYDSLGNLIIKGRFKHDQKYGIWKYYDQAGDVIRKEKY
ncbi:MAG: DUF3352 domain-containing protein, partial [Fulvivirga sp.]|nr:DUF3352 domain-containing protein [Fulvivirga sp.]